MSIDPRSINQVPTNIETQETLEEKLEASRFGLLSRIKDSLNNDTPNQGIFSVGKVDHKSNLYSLDFKNSKDVDEDSRTYSGYFKKIFLLMQNMRKQLSLRSFNIFDEIEKINMPDIKNSKAINPFELIQKMSDLFPDILIKSIYKPGEDIQTYKVILDKDKYENKKKGDVIDTENEREYPAEKLYSLLEKIDILFS
jgi:hypothetical protein